MGNFDHLTRAQRACSIQLLFFNHYTIGNSCQHMHYIESLQVDVYLAHNDIYNGAGRHAFTSD